MAKQERYFIGPRLLADIREVITRVDAIPMTTSGVEQPVRHQHMGRRGGWLRIGKTATTWPKGTLATITMYEQGTPPNETQGSPTQTVEDVVNHWGDVAANKWVGIQLAVNGHWYLVVAEC